VVVVAAFVVIAHPDLWSVGRSVLKLMIKYRGGRGIPQVPADCNPARRHAGLGAASPRRRKIMP